MDNNTRQSWQPHFAACAIGSLPYSHPEPAIKLIRENLPQIPHWPQLPRRGHVEHFIHQYLAPLARLSLVTETPERALRMDQDSPEWAEQLTEFYSVYLPAAAGEAEALNAFAMPCESALGFYAFLEGLDLYGTGGSTVLKGQIAGPLSVALNIYDHRRRAAYYDPQLRDILIKTLAMQAKWQVATLGRYGLPVLLFVDDPGVGAYGASTYVALARDQIVADLRETVEAIRQAGGIPGVHSCAGVDWGIFVEAGFDVISFDAYGYFNSLLPYLGDLETFVNRGGVLAWGMVPTSEVAFGETMASLARRWEENVDFLVQKGMDRERLRLQSLITPSCGTGTLTPGLAEHIYRLNRQLSDTLRGL